MNKLIKKIEKLKTLDISDVVNSRMKQFKDLGKQQSNEIFKELCFCFLTANYSAEGGIKIQNAIGERFLTLPENQLAEKLSELGHRFPNARARFICEARKYKDNIKNIITSFDNEDSAREWIVENIKGIGMKEASHFLRNIGYEDVAIIDFHIIDLLVREGIIPKPKTLTPKKYIEIEDILREISQETDISLGKLDLYLWYDETGKVLK